MHISRVFRAVLMAAEFHSATLGGNVSYHHRDRWHLPVAFFWSVILLMLYPSRMAKCALVLETYKQRVEMHWIPNTQSINSPKRMIRCTMIQLDYFVARYAPHRSKTS